MKDLPIIVLKKSLIMVASVYNSIGILILKLHYFKFPDFSRAQCRPHGICIYPYM